GEALMHQWQRGQYVSLEKTGPAEKVAEARCLPIYDVTASVAPGPPTERILTAHPTLDADNINLAAIYAESNPARGRLRSSDELSKEAKVVVDRRVSRRRKRR
ncbi:MAG: hypothetical protein WA177_06290, partial [Xanthobacteraceae bacterium]